MQVQAGYEISCHHDASPWHQLRGGFDCPHFQGVRQQHAGIFQNPHDAMRSRMWHQEQKSVHALVLAIVNEAWTP